MTKYQRIMYCLGLVTLMVIVVIVELRNTGPLQNITGFLIIGLLFVALVIAFSVTYAMKHDASTNNEASAEDPDEPPSYESVTTKPPPYHHLFAEATPTADVTPGNLPLPHRAPVPVHNMVQALGRTSGYPTVSDEPPPLYSEAVNENRRGQMQLYETYIIFNSPSLSPS